MDNDELLDEMFLWMCDKLAEEGAWWIGEPKDEDED